MQEQEPGVSQQVSESVGFPTQAPQNQKKSGINKFVIILILVFLVLGGAGFLLLRNSGQSIEPSSSPSVAGSSLEESFPSQENTPNPTPKVTPSPEAVNKSQITIKVLNGTGISGEAGALKTQLQSLGFEKIETANASSQNAISTEVTYSSTLAKSIQDEITTKLKSIYNQVDVKTGSIGAGIDIQIIVGLKKGTTPKPSTSAKPTSSAIPSATPKPSPSPTPAA